jgi:hypothetical protein
MLVRISHQIRAISILLGGLATNLRVPYLPGFLLSLLGCAKFMRLSL